MAAPKWASRWVADTWSYYYPSRTTDAPSLAWRTSQKHRMSSGSCDYLRNRITVTAGSDLIDQQITLIHEIAHAIDPPVDGRKAHDMIFYLLFWTLIKRYKLPRYEVMKQELTYRKTSIVVAEAIGIPGAEKLHEEYRQKQVEKRQQRRRDLSEWERVLTNRAG